MTPLFQKRHYNLIADGLAKATPEQRQAGVLYTLCDVLQRDNPKFNKDRFIDAAFKQKESK